MTSVTWTTTQTNLVEKPDPADAAKTIRVKDRKPVTHRGEVVSWVGTPSGVVGVVASGGKFVSVPVEDLQDAGVKVKA